MRFRLKCGVFRVPRDLAPSASDHHDTDDRHAKNPTAVCTWTFQRHLERHHDICLTRPGTWKLLAQRPKRMTACRSPVNHFIAQYRSPGPWFWRRGASAAHTSRISEDLAEPYLRPQRFTTHGKPYSSTTILSVCGVSPDNQPSPHPFYSIHTEAVHACHSKIRNATATRHGAVLRGNRNLELYCSCREG